MSQSRSEILALLLLCMGSLLISCSVSRTTSNPASNESIAKDSPRILFLNYQVNRDPLDSTYHARLLNMIVAEGTIKEKRKTPPDSMDGDLELRVLDTNGQSISYHHIPNPLDKSVEYVNDAGGFERRLIHLDSAQFSVRLKLGTGASSMVLERIIGENKEGKLLLKTPLI